MGWIITKYAVTVMDPDDIRFHMEKAVHLALAGRPGPVWIDLPLDVREGVFLGLRRQHHVVLVGVVELGRQPDVGDGDLVQAGDARTGRNGHRRADRDIGLARGRGRDAGGHVR